MLLCIGWPGTVFSMAMLRAVSEIVQVKPDKSNSRVVNLNAIYLGNKLILMERSNDLKSGYLFEMKAPYILARRKGSIAAEEQS